MYPASRKAWLLSTPELPQSTRYQQSYDRNSSYHLFMTTTMSSGNHRIDCIVQESEEKLALRIYRILAGDGGMQECSVS